MSDEERKDANAIIAMLVVDRKNLLDHLREAQQEIDWLRRKVNSLLAEAVVEAVAADLRNKPFLN